MVKHYDAFQSNFRIIAVYFRQMRSAGEFEPDLDWIVTHPKELFGLMSALTGDKRCEETCKHLLEIPKGRAGKGQTPTRLTVRGQILFWPLRMGRSG